jgi:tRNA 2-selenouridine synthase
MSAKMTAPTTDHSLLPVPQALERLAEFDAVIDVRSESEFADDHLPGAINCPVLDDAERAEVGTLYTRASPFEARRRGAALVARNIARHLETTFADRPRGWSPIVYCWRGGERSASMTLVMQRVGWRARRLQGGYKAYRRAVIEALRELPQRYRYRVLCGPTGSGKSRLLSALARAGVQVLDLERLGAHRGSVLGALPDLPQPSQKRFESVIWSALRSYDPQRPVFVESESRRLGKLQVPDALLEAMRAAPCLQLDLPLAERVRLLRQDYAHLESGAPPLSAQLDSLAPLHGRERVEAWKACASAGDWARLVGRLLEEHYDPAYRRSIGQHFPRMSAARRVDIASADDERFEAAARDLAAAPED